MDLFYYLFFVTLAFIIYIEVSVGNILFRSNASGSIGINLSSLVNFLIHPLYNRTLWNVSVLDLNYIFVLIVAWVIYHVFNLSKLSLTFGI